MPEHVTVYHQGLIYCPATHVVATRLPEETKILGMSPHVEFKRNLYVYKVEHPAIRGSKVLENLPRVEPEWDRDTFKGWKELAYKDPV